VRRERTAEASLAPEHEMETLEELDADDVFERRLADMKEAGHASEAQLQDLRDTYREALRTFLQLDEGEGPCAS
jgi:hypothetical protein